MNPTSLIFFPANLRLKSCLDSTGLHNPTSTISVGIQSFKWSSFYYSFYNPTTSTSILPKPREPSFQQLLDREKTNSQKKDREKTKLPSSLSDIKFICHHHRCTTVLSCLSPSCHGPVVVCQRVNGSTQ
jgi:hypothetical protein